MTKKQKDYPCVPPERVAFLMSVGAGYEGYIELYGGQRIFVEIIPDLSLMLRQQNAPENTLMSVYIPHPANPSHFEKSQHWAIGGLQKIQTINSTVGVTTGIVEHSGIQGSFRLKTESAQFSPKYYSSGWKGGSAGNIKTYKVTTVAKSTGRWCFYIGIALDFGKLMTGEQSLKKATVNTLLGAVGVWGGPVGLLISGLYFGLDLVGAFDGPPTCVYSDPTAKYIHPRDNTRIEQVNPLEMVPSQKFPSSILRKHPVLKQGKKR